MTSLSICKYEPKLDMFCVLREKGKSMSSGGYGIIYSFPTMSQLSPSIYINTQVINVPSDTHTCISNTSTKHVKINHSKKHLLIEEATYLNERGLLKVFDSCGANTMSTHDLYEIMLNEINFPLPVYITYSYLRSHTFIVVRHTPQKLDLLKRIRDEESYYDSNDLCSVDKYKKKKPWL